MSDLDAQIRFHLARLVEVTPMTLSTEGILRSERPSDSSAPGPRSYVLAAAVLAVVGMIGGLSFKMSQSDSNDVVAGPPHETAKPVEKTVPTTELAPTAAAPFELPANEDRDMAAEQRLLDGLSLGRWRSPEEEAAMMALQLETLSQQEVFVQGCMTEAGFDYFFDPPENSLGLDTNFEGQHRSPTWMMQYGFGYTTLMYTQVEVGADLVGTPRPFAPPILVFPDRTEEQLLAMTDDEVSAYWMALYGRDGTRGIRMTKESYEASCFGKAEEANPSPSNLVFQEWTREQVNDLRDGIEADAVIQDLLDVGLVCVARSGFEIAEERAVMNELGSRVEALFEIVPSQPSNPEFLAELALIQEYELGIARAFLDCGLTLDQMAPHREEVAIRLAYESGLLQSP